MRMRSTIVLLLLLLAANVEGAGGQECAVGDGSASQECIATLSKDDIGPTETADGGGSAAPDNALDEDDEDDEYDDEDDVETCTDDDERCPDWASQGECDINPSYMLTSCKKSCSVCTECTDDHEKCQLWASTGECKANPTFMLTNCELSCYVCSPFTYTDDDLIQGKDLGVAQDISETENDDATVERMEEIITSGREYMLTTVRETMEYGMDKICTNQHEHCTRWAAEGECDANEKYMKFKCGPACQSCHVNSLSYRCPLDPDAVDAWGPGDLNKMFEKLTAEPYLTRHSVRIESSPQLNGGPWVITMDDVVSQEEADQLIQIGADTGYKRSADVGTVKADGTWDDYFYDGRTSTTAWCSTNCDKDPHAHAVIERMSNLTGIDALNSEYLQLLRYEVGQFYNVHHDYIAVTRDRQCGPRILTMYLYLSDVEAGGGTNFDKLNITVMPKRGRAVLWPSVFDDRPADKDDRTTHQALPVEKGLKFGANAWFHLRDFKTAMAKGCN